ncbi:MAG: hypothetical protein AAF228_12150 [Pseudomonadota bacterium]
MAEYFLAGSGIKGERAARIERTALNMRNSMLDDSREESIRFIPDERSS